MTKNFIMEVMKGNGQELLNLQ